MRFDFEMRESQDPDGHLRLAVIGELDLATAPALVDRLAQLLRDGLLLRLDLSGLEFIDACGMAAVIRAVRDAGEDGRRLEVDPDLTPQVRRVSTVLHVERLILSGENE